MLEKPQITFNSGFDSPGYAMQGAKPIITFDDDYVQVQKTRITDPTAKKSSDQYLSLEAQMDPDPTE